MHTVYAVNDRDKRKLKFLYDRCGIDTRYSVVPDYSLPAQEWQFFPASENLQPFPSMEKRMKVFHREAAPLALNAINDCLERYKEQTTTEFTTKDITHLITVSCTGMSAPGLDLQIAEALELSPNVFRTSVNFMGCYAAIHALKLAKLICEAEPDANVVIADTELCTLHFQQEYSADNAASSLLFADGSAAALVSNKHRSTTSITLDGFFSHVSYKGKKDMAWELSSKGFLMTLSGYVPQLIEEDIDELVVASLDHHNVDKSSITHWCIHPGGKKILQAIENKLNLSKDDLCYSRSVLAKYGNMSSPTILFVLKEMLNNIKHKAKIFGVAFGPGLTMETFLASKK